MVLEHRDRDRSHFPHVWRIHIRSVLYQQVDALTPAKARSIMHY